MEDFMKTEKQFQELKKKKKKNQSELLGHIYLTFVPIFNGYNVLLWK